MKELTKIEMNTCDYNTGWLKCELEAEYELIINGVSHGKRCLMHKRNK